MSTIPSIALVWIDTLPEDRKASAQKLVETIQENLPKGFECELQGKMLAWVVPLTIFPQGYHCSPNTPLPFLNLASQKNALTLYHMGIYADSPLLAWFLENWEKHTSEKLDMGKSCIRFKKPDKIPFSFLGELIQKMSPEQWIKRYTEAFLNSKK